MQSFGLTAWRISGLTAYNIVPKVVMSDAVDPVDIAIGARIRARREELRITQAQLAAGAGVTFQQIQKYERGANRVVAYAAHGLFNGGALQRISKSALSDVIVTNTVPLRDDISVRDSHKIAQLSVAPLLAEAVVRVQTGQSVQSLRSFESESAETRNENQ